MRKHNEYAAALLVEWQRRFVHCGGAGELHGAPDQSLKRYGGEPHHLAYWSGSHWCAVVLKLFEDTPDHRPGERCGVLRRCLSRARTLQTPLTERLYSWTLPRECLKGDDAYQGRPYVHARLDSGGAYARWVSWRRFAGNKHHSLHWRGCFKLDTRAESATTRTKFAVDVPDSTIWLKFAVDVPKPTAVRSKFATDVPELLCIVTNDRL